MGYRRYRDARGEEWQVWEVKPRPRAEWSGWYGVERRSPDPVLRHPGPDRRAAPAERPAPPLLTPGLEEGWLTFEGATEKRRLAPVPAGWEEMDDDALEELRASARSVTRVRPL